MSSESDLKPCPFCGGEARKVYKSTGQTTHIECAKCKAQFPKSTMNNRYDEAWNARVERTCKRVLFKPTGVLVCSDCGAGMPKQLDKHCYLHYCPNCGAKVVEQ